MASIRSLIQATPARQALYHLISGNALVFILQIIGLYITLTYYSRSALSLYTLFVTLTYLSTKLTTLRLPELIIREPDEVRVQSSAGAIMTLTILLTCLLLVVYYLLAKAGVHFQLFTDVRLSTLFPLFGLAVIMSSLGQLTANLLLKQDKTRQLSTGRILKAASQVIIMILLISQPMYGLILAWIAGLVMEIVYHVIILRSYPLQWASLTEVISLIRSNKDIIYYTLPISLLLSIHDNIVVQSIEYYYGPAVLAVFAVVDRVLRLPSQIIGGAAAQVLYKYGSDTYHQSSSQYSKQLTRGLRRISVLFGTCVLGCMVLAYPVFDWVFDGKWSDASDYLVKYAWWILPFSLIAVLRNVPVMLKQQRRYFFLELLLVATLGVSLYLVGSRYSIETYFMVKYGVELVFFIAMIWIVMRMVSVRSRDL